MRAGSAIILPSVLIVIIAVAWSLGWLYLSQSAAQRLDRLLAGQASAGRALVCQDRSHAGFPFRFEVTCAAPRLTIAGQDTRLVIEAKALKGIAQIYDTDQFIFEVEGPTNAQRTRQGSVLLDMQVTTGTLRASVSLKQGHLARTSLVATEIGASLARGLGSKITKISATRFAAHLRLAENNAVDVALQLDEFS
ncbi:MAG: DUF2125 domain-containing protein, partial [Alphaproteobacteria bacterium]